MAASIPNGFAPIYKPNATTTGVSASQVQQPPVMTQAQMDALRAGAQAGMAQYQATGSFTNQTPAQNLAAVINQPGNTVAQNPTPFITNTLAQAAKDTAAQAPQGVPQGPPMPQSQGATPPPSSGGVTPPKFDAAGIAASRVAAQRAALAGSVNAYDASRKQSYDYTTQNTQDQRTLDNAMFKETNNPFSGKYQYDTTNILRNNGIADTQSQMSYNNDIAAENQKLADFDAGAPGMTQDIQSQLEHQNLTDNIALAGVTGTYNGSPTYDASQAGIKNGITAANDNATQTGNYISPANAALLQQQQQNSAAYATATPEQQAILHQNNIDIAKQLGESYDPKTGQYSGGNYSTRTIAGQTLDMNNAKDMATLTGYMSDGKGGYIPTNAKQQQDLTDAWTATNNLGSVTPALSKLTGIPVGTPTQTAKNQAQQIAISSRNATNSEKSTANSVTNTTNSENNAKITQLLDVWKNSGVAPAGLESVGVHQGDKYTGGVTAKETTADEFIKSMDGTPLISNIAGMRRVTDPVALEKAILDSGMTPEEMTKAYRAYNIPMK